MIRDDTSSRPPSSGSSFLATHSTQQQIQAEDSLKGMISPSSKPVQQRNQLSSIISNIFYDSQLIHPFSYDLSKLFFHCFGL